MSEKKVKKYAKKHMFHNINAKDSIVGMLLYVTSDTVIFGRKTSLLNNIVCFVL